jgi:hypothetical protein
LRPAFAIALAVLLLTAISAAPASASGLSHGDRQALERYAADRWHSFDLLVDARTGLPDDNVTADGKLSGYTSPTNIGAYLWSTLGAREGGSSTAARRPRGWRARWRPSHASSARPVGSSSTGTTRPPARA